ncbi:MAG: hypothetical protein U5K54_05300 [Cytophagales bacterium]|nr:hypothetical protein [Cytophagales bacterium]
MPWTSATAIREDTAKFTGAIYQVADVDHKRNVVVVNNAFLKAAKYENELQLIGKIISFLGREMEIIGVVPEPKVIAPQIYFPISLLSLSELKSHPTHGIF